MKLGDLTEKQRLQLVKEGQKAFDSWYKLTEGKAFATRIPLSVETIFRAGYARAMNNMLARMTTFRR